MINRRTLLLIGGELDLLLVDIGQPDGINLTEGGLFYLPSHLPDLSIILNIYEDLRVINEQGHELFAFKVTTYIRPRKQQSINNQSN